MKKIELHLDALITIIVVFILAISFILFQRYQYSDVLQENIDLNWEHENLKVNYDFQSGLLAACSNKNKSEEKAPEAPELTTPTE